MAEQYNTLEYIDNYQKQYNLPVSAVAYELAISECHYRRYFIKSKSKRSPSSQACRVAQLLAFIKDNGLQPPPPNFFD